MTDDELRTIAMAASPGPWHRHTYGHGSVRRAAGAVTRALFLVAVPPEVKPTMTDLSWVHPDDEGPAIALTGNGPRQTENADYIAAVSPDVVLALLDRLAAAEGARR